MSYKKYTDALTMMDAIVAITDAEYVCGTKNAAEVKWDELYEFVYANFATPESGKETWTDKVEVTDTVESELESMREMFSLEREEIEERMREIPVTILEQCFPVWMARYMLRFCNSPVGPVNLDTFDKFHYMYGYMILNCRKW